MIPKKIHYCWFGNNPKSSLIQECIESWKKFCPDFEIIEWNEINSKQYSNRFYKDALRKKKYAFAADYIRTIVLYEQGGIYLDTDMLLLKTVEDLLKYDFFTAEEAEGRVAFGFFGCIKHHRFLEQMLYHYNSTEFNVFSSPVITHTFSPIINKQSIQSNEIIFEPEYFYPLKYEDKSENHSKYTTPNTIAVHLWNHSWQKIPRNDFKTLFNNLINVVVDFLFYNYSYAYFKRYFREFSRKIYHKIKFNS